MDPRAAWLVLLRTLPLPEEVNTKDLPVFPVSDGKPDTSVLTPWAQTMPRLGMLPRGGAK